MDTRIVGVDLNEPNAVRLMERVLRLEELGIGAAWLSGGQPDMDALTLLAAIAVRTEHILLGTAIVPTWPRHPITAVQQAKTVAQLAPVRFRLGVGPSHRDEMEGMYGFDFHRPLVNLREYLQVSKSLLQRGTVDFDGRHYHAHAAGRPMPDVPVMASALRPMAFRLCGAEADGAISWVCPGEYLRDVALPAMREGAEEMDRPTPPLIAHAVVCVHDDSGEIKEAVLAELDYYPKSFFYRKMFTVAGFPEVEATGTWSDRLVEAVVFSGREDRVAARLHRLFEWGASELLISVVGAGRDREASRERSLQLVARVSREVRR